MAVTILQSTGTTPVLSGAGTTTLTCTLPDAPPDVGNLLVLLIAGDKDTGTLTLPGFTQQHVITGQDVSLYMAYKVSDGTEQAISPVWANVSAAGNTAWYAELRDTLVTGTTYWQVSASASTPYSASAVQARSTNTTGLSTHAGMAIGAWGVDDGMSVAAIAGGARVYSNSYSEKCDSHSVSSRGGIFVASKSIAAGVTTECTFSYSGLGTTADQISGCVAVFSKLVEAKGFVAGVVARAGTATGTVTHADAVVGTISSGTVTGSVGAAGSVTGTAAEADGVEGESS